ncbi:MAG: transposase [Solirubrobacteraceae bacterium]
MSVAALLGALHSRHGHALLPRSAWTGRRRAARGIFRAEGAEQANQRVTNVLERLATAAPKVCQLLEAAEEDLTAFYAFPPEHWTKLRSTNPLERVNKGSVAAPTSSRFPQRPSRDPARRRAAPRAERRVAGATPLPLRRSMALVLTSGRDPYI